MIKITAVYLTVIVVTDGLVVTVELLIDRKYIIISTRKKLLLIKIYR
jgi:hypothetical protein